MIIFADYDNIDALAKGRGLEHIILKTITAISGLRVAPQPRIDIRFYGGWFYGTQLSRLGQELSSEIGRTFPKPLTLPWTGQPKPITVLVNAHIARSLTASEQQPLHHTFRRRPFSGRLYFRRPIPAQCPTTSCPLDVVEQFLATQKCPEARCAITQSDILDRCEQKLVDTMLVSDLIFWSSRPNHPLLAVLSSDDDMWPGIRTAMAISRPIIQIHTSRSPQHQTYVNRLDQNSYLQANF